jgi:two-component system cell cycle response regulator
VDQQPEAGRTIVTPITQISESSGPLAGSRVLVVDDDPVTCSALNGLLRKRGYEVIVANDGARAYEILQEPDAPSLAIIDWMMPGLDGIELCRKLRSLPSFAYTYIVMLSGRTDKEDFLAGLEAGADDYVGKPFDIDELHARIRAGQRVLASYERLRNRSNQDDLTGLFNRSAITEVLRRELAQAGRDGTPTSLILAEVDDFRQVNDVHGHSTSDAALCELARLLQASIRTYDVAGRFWGGKFMIVVPGCEMDRTIQVAEKLRRAVERHRIRAGDTALTITISLGVASSGGFAIDEGILLTAAERALERAKRAGRNRVEPLPSRAA